MACTAEESRMSARDDILAACRAARPPGDHPLPDLPAFPPAWTDLRAGFEQALALMGGRSFALPAETTLGAFIAAQFTGERLIRDASGELPEFPRVDAVNRPRDLENVDVAVARARFGVAETGSVFLSEGELRVNTVGYLAQHLVVLLDPAALVAGIADAYRRSDFGEVRYASLMTGPSATADIEGVLIRGAQGVRSLTVIFCPVTPMDSAAHSA
jgi:L-lactate dehydrogenase complex protein LldG